MLEFNRILDRLSNEDSIGHLFIVDIKFHNKNPKIDAISRVIPPCFWKNQDWSCTWVLYGSANERLEQKRTERYYK